MGYPTGFDADIECMSSDEKSDNEGKNETVSSISSNNTGNPTVDTSTTLEVSIPLKSVRVGVLLQENGLTVKAVDFRLGKSGFQVLDLP